MTFSTQCARDCFVRVSGFALWVLLPFLPFLLLCIPEFLFDWPQLYDSGFGEAVMVIYAMACGCAALGWMVMWVGVVYWRLCLPRKRGHDRGQSAVCEPVQAIRAAQLHAHVLVLSLLRAADEYGQHSMHALHESSGSGCCSWRGDRRRVVGWVCVPLTRQVRNECVEVRHMHRVYADGSRGDAE